MNYELLVSSVRFDIKAGEYSPFIFECFPHPTDVGFDLRPRIREEIKIFHEIMDAMFDPKKKVKISVVIEDEV